MKTAGQPVWVVLAAFAGALVGAAARFWIAGLRRGAVIRPGFIELPAALLAGLGVASTVPSRWPLVVWIGLLTVVLSAVDLKHHRLPDAITLPAAPFTLLLAVVTELAWPDSGSWVRALLGGLLVGGSLYLLAVLAPRGMGRGDAKLGFSIGIALGYGSWAELLLGVFAGFVLGALAGLLGVALRRWTLSSALPFGPALLLGGWLVLAVPAVSQLAGVGR